MRTAISLALAALIATACSGEEAASENNAAAHYELGNAPATNEAAANEATANAAAPAAPSYTLAANGLGPGLSFGLPKARAVELATAAFGAPTGRERIDCPAGPMEFVSFHDLDLVFEEGRFTGWSIDGPRPALRTAQGIGVGDPRSALGGIPVAEDDGMGPGFDLGEYGGYLDETGRRVASLAAGSICEFG